jgi:isomaltose glucohydrolase
MSGRQPGRRPTMLDQDDRGPHLVDASVAVLKAGQGSSGAFVASPTFGPYAAYCWLRDGSFCASALDAVGERRASRRFHDWVANVVLDAADGLEQSIARVRAGHAPLEGGYLHCRYRMDGTATSDDWPTFQLDGPGIWLWALARHAESGGWISPRQSLAARWVTRYLAAFWPLPCWDAWEEFGDRVHTSTLAAIRTGLAAAQRTIAGVASDGSVREAIEAIDGHPAFSAPRFTKWAGSDEVDASLLWMVAPYGLLEPTDPRFAASVSQIERALVSPPMGVHRYPSDTFYGGGAWPVLTAALGGVYLRRGDPGDGELAWAALRWIEAQADEDGKLPEQVDSHALAPKHIRRWIDRWGPSAHPLLWSHAAYLELYAGLVRSDIDVAAP